MKFLGENLKVNETLKVADGDIWVDEGRAYLLVEDGKAVSLLMGPGSYHVSDKLNKNKIYWKINNGGLIEFYENFEIRDPFTLYLFEPSEKTLMAIADLDLTKFDIIKAFNKLSCETTECVLEIIRQVIRSAGSQDGDCYEIRKIFSKFTYLNITVREMSFCW